ncbi:Outer membrane protein transport protein (OMPP1/FadL/TodX) [Flavobacterium fluvii]|uniref:Outer membrane protein transport protein (OMPP1/FadL/TodX) n=1 Tax=Flavobacterium fluvii TaxID=468056 RepID=A0A1M5P2R1_9FLAO|nr:outer membrane protein transport protein [Flavobacterium fluvii]SHG95689.1 Outer membrane protein transport protein (OMPP1/FadL/TodX) [Flavobacterium fluvii]
MKKYIYLLFAGLSFSVAQSQEISDAMRYAQDNLSGTARFRAMGGAFGALGGDLSSINVNPAGSAVFSNNQITLTLSNFNTKNNSNYFGTHTSANDNAFEMNQTGGVFVFRNHNPNNDWKKFSFSINYENINNFDNTVFSAGVNPTNSVDGYFLSYADGVPLSVLQDSFYGELDHGAQQAFLGYQAYIINPVDPNDANNSQYTSNVTPGGNYYQENSVYSNGYNGKLSFNMATSFKDQIYIGINLNSHFTDFYRSSTFYERNGNPTNLDFTVKSIAFDNDLYTYGTGFSFQIGAIAKVTNEVRLGLAYESPTWYHLSDEFSQDIAAVSENINGELPADIVNPNIINYYSPYELQTPGKLTGSFAYVFGKTGLLSIDYAIKDYGNTQFKPSNDVYYRGLNNEMSNTLNTTSELRIGGEYKINGWSLRGGYRFEQSPYKNSSTIGDLTAFSGGFGYNFGVFKLDFAYSHSDRNSQQPFFNQGFTDAARINTQNNNVSMTFLFEM